MYKEIDRYGIIGDLHTVALVCNDGSIDFMCWPHFDSPTIFGAMLDDQKGGAFKISPIWPHGVSKQIYLPDTNILFTRFLSDEGVGELCDFMPLGRPELKHMLVRSVKTIRGQIKYRVNCAPRFNYGLTGFDLRRKEGGVVFESKDDRDFALSLLCDVPLHIQEKQVEAQFVLKAGQTAYFILETDPDEDVRFDQARVDELLSTTIAFWRGWLRRSNYQGRWREVVNRSALTLKLLMSQHYGSMVASPTFGLPEIIGGPRNWDYRYTWIRDTSFTLSVLMRLGFMQEATAFLQWIEQRCRELKVDDSLQVMYGINGRHDLREWTLDQWEGYKKSSPVHIGNAAFQQIQLDIYGELMDAIYLYNRNGQTISYEFWQNLVRLMGWLSKNWQRPDKGIWEIRGKEQQFLYSKVMCWVAFDRAIKLAVDRSFPAPLQEWLDLRDKINIEIRRDYWSQQRQSFTQYKGSNALDAASLIMPKVGFIAPNDPLWLSSLKAIEEELIDDFHVYRYRVDLAADDGVPGAEGSFCMCTFWYVDCLAACGRLDEARLNFEKMLGYANHLGHFSEELGPKGQGLGNFPQAFTHLSLINTAFDLNRFLDEAGKD